jgi:hypothetical protein
VFILKGLRYEQSGGDSAGIAKGKSDKKNVGRLDRPFVNGWKREKTFGLKEGTRHFA